MNMQLDPLNEVLENASKINDYDYNKMINDFQLEEVKGRMRKERVWIYY